MESLGDILKRMMTDTRHRREEWWRQSDKWTKSSPSSAETAPCPRCNGVGFISHRLALGQFDYVQCGCRRDLRREERHRWAYANLPNAQAPRTFENLEITAELAAPLEAAREFATGETRHHVLTLYGNHGTAKSHLLEAIGREMLAQQHWIKYVFAPDMLDALRETYDEESKLTFEQVYELYSLPEVLLLDDLGAEKATEWTIEKLTRLVDQRIRNGNRLVVATNLNVESMAEKLSPRLADRLFDSRTGAVLPVRVSGKSYRTGILWKLPWSRKSGQ